MHEKSMKVPFSRPSAAKVVSQLIKDTDSCNCA